MCMYCERRTDIKFGWEQPKLPIHIPIKHCPECGRKLGGVGK